MDNGGRAGTNTLLLASEPFTLTVRGAAVASVSAPQTIGSLTIASNSWMTTASSLMIMGNATIQASGGIVADGMGYPGGQGSGHGNVFYLSASGIYVGGGGGYGGAGARYGIDGGAGYGSILQPIDRGSGGANVPPVSAPAGSGGGAVGLTVNGALLLNGRISADGNGGMGERTGGGSGGSV